MPYLSYVIFRLEGLKQKSHKTPWKLPRHCITRTACDLLASAQKARIQFSTFDPISDHFRPRLDCCNTTRLNFRLRFGGSLDDTVRSTNLLTYLLTLWNIYAQKLSKPDRIFFPFRTSQYQWHSHGRGHGVLGFVDIPVSRPPVPTLSQNPGYILADIQLSERKKKVWNKIYGQWKVVHCATFLVIVLGLIC